MWRNVTCETLHLSSHSFHTSFPLTCCTAIVSDTSHCLQRIQYTEIFGCYLFSLHLPISRILYLLCPWQNAVFTEQVGIVLTIYICIPEKLASNFGGATAILTKVFRCFSQILQENVGISLRCSWNSFHFIFHQSSYHSALYILSY
jgi:hypothetical protein